MLNNIKSIFFTKIVFSYLDYKNKLDLARYNKNLQKIIDINIINYKRISRKYIIYETKEKAKEYDGYSDNLIFEGKYFNGKRNGFGKEYYRNGEIKFKGEFLNGKKWNDI